VFDPLTQGDGFVEPPLASPEVPSDKLDLRVLSAIRRIIRSVGFYSKRLASAHGVTVPQLICLTKITQAGSITIKGLAETVYLSPSTLVGIVDRLEDAGLASRERSRTDRRLVAIRATPKGVRLVAEAPSPLQDKLLQALGRLSDLEQLAIAVSLERVVDLMEIGHVDATPMLQPDTMIEPKQEIVEIRLVAEERARSDESSS
jgi:DNA-binding MarR family transcriptional regulator